ncbi:MAG: diaminopimelate decarboxylase [Muribaculum sp.]|nr:diaminopimelate decarboxylase [Muribaculum sp.]
MPVFPIEKFRTERTPFYYYDIDLLRQTLDSIRNAVGSGYIVHYAVKANANPLILREICRAGLGADCVSGGEIEAALKAGIPASGVVFAGVGKSDEEIALALTAKIGCFNVESIEELRVIEAMAADRNVVANVALRVNPNVDAHTHHYITTGLKENKFGIALEMLDSAVQLCLASKSLSLRGLHFHIGSQITAMDPYVVLCDRINSLLAEYEAKGIEFDLINVGGGLGVDYDHPDEHPIPDFKAYFDTFRRHLNLRPGQQLHFELGRAVVAQCGSLITKVLYVKQGLNKRFVIVDAGMTDLIRPALYQSHHLIQNITSSSAEEFVYDIVGPVCESSDCFGVDERLPLTVRGDLLALRSAGAYGEAMASHYNLRPFPRTVTI